jgi:uncharacterized damage-inducible protein DinB
MRADDIRFLFEFDRWATTRILDTSARVMADDWEESNRIDRRGLGGILVHQLGAHERWRSGWQGVDRPPRREELPLISSEELREAWILEWAALDAYLATLTDDDTDGEWHELTRWHSFLHVVNHGTQHRSEAAVLLTIFGHSPGDLDLIDFAPARTKA